MPNSKMNYYVISLPIFKCEAVMERDNMLVFYKNIKSKMAAMYMFGPKLENVIKSAAEHLKNILYFQKMCLIIC